MSVFWRFFINKKGLNFQTIWGVQKNQTERTLFNSINGTNSIWEKSMDICHKHGILNNIKVFCVRIGYHSYFGCEDFTGFNTVYVTKQVERNHEFLQHIGNTRPHKCHVISNSLRKGFQGYPIRNYPDGVKTQRYWINHWPTAYEIQKNSETNRPRYLMPINSYSINCDMWKYQKRKIRNKKIIWTSEH